MAEPLCNDCGQTESLHPDIGHDFVSRPDGMDPYVTDPTVPALADIPDQAEIVEYGVMLDVTSDATPDVTPAEPLE
jgi:hypothetical protein